MDDERPHIVCRPSSLVRRAIFILRGERHALMVTVMKMRCHVSRLTSLHLHARRSTCRPPALFRRAVFILGGERPPTSAAIIVQGPSYKKAPRNSFAEYLRRPCPPFGPTT